MLSEWAFSKLNCSLYSSCVLNWTIETINNVQLHSTELGDSFDALEASSGERNGIHRPIKRETNP